MRKQMYLVGIFSLFLMGLASCSQDETAPQDPKGTGDVKINFLGFDQTPKSRGDGGGPATPSPKKPITSWQKSVKDMMILFVNNDKVVDARVMTPPTSGDLAQQTLTYQQVPAMTGGQIYIIANSGQSGVLRQNEEATPPISWSPLTVKNMKFSTLCTYLTSAANTTELPNDTKYNQPAEIFLAKASNVNIVADKTTTITDPLTLTRAVGLFRIRLNPIGLNKTACKFNVANAFVFIRKADTKIYMTDGHQGGHSDRTGIYVSKPFLTQEPTATDYAGTDPILDANYTCYQDFLAFPGGGSTSDKKYEVVIKGIATADYVYADGSKATAGDPVYFHGAFNQTLTANGITVLNVDVNSQGIITPPAPGEKYGVVEIKVAIKDWGNVTTGNIIV